MSSQNESVFSTICSQVIAKLRNGLLPHFTYHNPEHTLDVLEQAQRIAADAGICDEEDLLLLKVAAVYHDTGFLFTYAGHEEKSTELAAAELPELGFSEVQIKKISGMIRATKIPQSPQNLLEEIICDADLDYLGRDDFETISNNLYREFAAVGIVQNYNDWMQKQISFLSTHRYFTRSSNEIREPRKKAQLEKLRLSFNNGKL